jgi:ABC-2 type transport system permease protein
MSDIAIVGLQTRYWLKATFRNPRAVVFTLVFPVILLVMFNSIFIKGSDSVDLSPTEQVAGSAYFTAGMLAYATMLSSFTQMLISLTTQRESGELKRYRGTPVPAWTFIVSFALRSVTLVALMTAIMLGIAHFAYDVTVPAAGVPSLIVYVLLGTATMCSLGIALTSVVDSVDAASSVGPFTAVILSFVSGIFVPVDQLPNWLEEFGRIFPPFHLAAGLQHAFATTGGNGLEAGNVAVLAVWLAAGVVLAARRFRWEPQTAKG